MSWVFVLFLPSGIMLAASCIWPAPSYAETSVSLYGGSIFPENTDLVSRPLQNPTSREVRWHDLAMLRGPTVGARLTHWWEWAGLQLEAQYLTPDLKANHALRTTPEKISDEDSPKIAMRTVMVGINGVFRYRFHDYFTPYIGIGTGLSITKARVFVYEPVGLTQIPAGLEDIDTRLYAQWLVGVTAKLTPKWSVFTEYKLSQTQHHFAYEDIVDQVTLTLHHVMVGASYTF